MEQLEFDFITTSDSLSFDYVFLLGCTENKWEKNSNNLPFKLNLLFPGEPKKATEEESRRLFYVALTRARKHIEVSYSLQNDKEKESESYICSCF